MIECTFFGKEARFHHVGMGVKSIREANPSCEVVVNRTQGVSMSFVRMTGITVDVASQALTPPRYGQLGICHILCSFYCTTRGHRQPLGLVGIAVAFGWDSGCVWLG